MKLNRIASALTRVVSPATAAVLKASTGYTTGADGTQAPAYASDQNVVIDVQALTARELDHIDSLNIQGVVRGVWSTTTLRGVDRQAGTGGDILTFDDGDGAADWLVVHVIETWNGAWCHVAVQKQVSS